MPLYSIRGGTAGGDEYRVLNVPRVSIYQNAAFSSTTAVEFSVTWDSLEYDTDSMWESVTHPGRITVSSPGIYLFNCWMEWVSNATGFRQQYFRKNGAGIAAQATFATALTGSVTDTVLSAQVSMNRGDYMEVRALQNSGGGLNVSGATLASRLNGFQACLISTLG